MMNIDKFEEIKKKSVMVNKITQKLNDSDGEESEEDMVNFVSDNEDMLGREDNK